MDPLLDRLADLEAIVESQRRALERQQDDIAALTDGLASERHRHADVASSDAPLRSSRRKLLTGGAVAAGAAVVGATVGARPVAAVDGTDLVVGANNTSEAGNTRINATGVGQFVNKNIFTVSDQNSTSQYPAAMGAYGEGDRVNNGLYAYTGDRDNADTNTGHAIVATSAGGRSNLLLTPGGSNPTSDTYAHRRGEVRSTGGDLWFCTGSGTPGSWRRLAGPLSAGAVHVIDPARVYDSRFADGPLGTGFNREVSVADAIDVETGDVTSFNVVPPGATSVHFNVTITETAGSGFVLVAPGTATTVTGSTINWSGNGQTAANGSLTTLDEDRNVRVFVGGVGGTHFIIDITGYTA